MGGIVSMEAVRVSRSLRLPDTVQPVVIHHGGFVIWLSQGLAALLGHDNRPFIGRSVLRFVAPEYVQRAAAALERMQGRSRLRVELVREDGGRVAVEVRGKTILLGGIQVRWVEMMAT